MFGPPGAPNRCMCKYTVSGGFWKLLLCVFTVIWAACANANSHFKKIAHGYSPPGSKSSHGGVAPESTQSRKLGGPPPPTRPFLSGGSRPAVCARPRNSLCLSCFWPVSFSWVGNEVKGGYLLKPRSEDRRLHQSLAA